VATADPPSADERYCAWYGAPGGDGVLYFGEAAFWWAMAHAGGDPTADLRRPGPQLVGRFDLAREQLLPPLDVGRGEGRSGVWDVLADGGEVYFTTFYEGAGAVDPATGVVRRLDLGAAPNELGIGPDGLLLLTRYGSGTQTGDGNVVGFRRDGRIAREWQLPPPAGYRVAPKTPAWDEARGALWVTTDLLPEAPGEGRPLRHDAYRLDLAGAAVLQPASPELQFAARGPDGRFYRALVAGRQLALEVSPSADAPAQRVLLDPGFAPELDFVQDIQPADDGRVAVSRWSGIVHVLHPDGSVGSVQLPRLDPSGLYYTTVLHGDRLCATYCADVTVVCADAP